MTTKYPERARTLFLSDLHLGYWVSRGADAIEVIRNTSADNIFLVGDVVDESRMQRRWYWPQSHQAVVDHLLDLNSRCNVRATPGNHDIYLRRSNPLETIDPTSNMCNLLSQMLTIEHCESFDYVMTDGRKLKVTHGDLFDQTERKMMGIPKLGSLVFDRFNWVFSRWMVIELRRLFKLVLTQPSTIESRLIEATRSEGYDGVVFGHLHEPKLYQTDGFLVANCGDWMMNTSFLIETIDGELELYNAGKLVESSSRI